MLQNKLKETNEEKQVTSHRISKSSMDSRAKMKKDAHLHFSGRNIANVTMTMSQKKPESELPKAPLH